jgi:hypothetical protein
VAVVCRLDLINAIRAYGGCGLVAEKLQWSVAKVSRRPRGYWCKLPNVKAELDVLIDEFALPMQCVPRKSFLEKVGRYDLWKGLERNGGAEAVRVCLCVYLWGVTAAAAPR